MELITLVLLIGAGFKGEGLSKILLGICVPIALVLFWSRFMAPMSPHRLNELERAFAEVVIFGGTALISYRVYGVKLALIYVGIVTINAVLDHVL
ncbi:hypothetical protein FD51_GL000319 [Lacticaseibacillus zeae DSM 20178 = KCTC 3804]|nr:hypothetical protein FD51_GL000319 [Lacticaseibacillus zeae DSM 20178 = KCTC 3804]